jgi:hypothetical protein
VYRRPVAHDHLANHRQLLQLAGDEFGLEFRAVDPRLDCRHAPGPTLHVEGAGRDIEEIQYGANARDQVRVRVGDDVESRRARGRAARDPSRKA